MFRTREDGTEVGTCDSCGTHYDTAQNEPRDQGAGWPRCGLCWAARRKAEEALGMMPRPGESGADYHDRRDRRAGRFTP